MMTTRVPVESPSRVPTSEDEPAPLRIQVHYPSSTTVVVTLAGIVDAATVPWLRGVLWPRLQSTVENAIVDLCGVEFLSVEGLQLLHQAYLHARHNHAWFRLSATHHEVLRALDVGGLAPWCFSSHNEALLDLASVSPLASRVPELSRGDSRAS